MWPLILDQCAHVVIDVLASSSEIVYEPLPVDDPMQRRPDISKAKRLFGWEPSIELREGVQRTADYFRSRATSVE